jgi:regulator of protease activity HflC (stomatin/prohibitin superfamily)
MLDRLVEFLLSVLKIFQAWTVVAEYERAVLLRFGKFRKVLEPGLHLKYPFYVDEPLHVNVVFNTKSLRAQSLTTQDRKQIVASAVVAYTIKDPKVFLIEVEGEAEVIADSVYGCVSEAVSKSPLDEIDCVSLSRKATEVIRRRADRWGVRIISITFSDLVECPSMRHWVDGIGAGVIHTEGED